jgi:formate hydrogenlyase subunit 3/multisubunit Na+/H+ antiporter MnhD subunit
MDELGGLIHRLRASAVISLVGTLGIAALPPFNGFVSEWLIFQGLFQGFRIGNNLVGILIVVAGAGLALTGGLAMMGFARAFGIPFLGMPAPTAPQSPRSAVSRWPGRACSPPPASPSASGRRSPSLSSTGSFARRTASRSTPGCSSRS